MHCCAPGHYGSPRSFEQSRHGRRIRRVDGRRSVGARMARLVGATATGGSLPTARLPVACYAPPMRALWLKFLDWFSARFGIGRSAAINVLCRFTSDFIQ